MKTQRELVEDWGTPFLDDETEHRERVDALVEELQKLNHDGIDKLGWWHVGSTGGFRYYAPVDGDLTELRTWVEGDFEASTKTLAELGRDLAVTRKLDQNVDQVRILEENEHNRVLHMKMKPMYWSAPRDSCIREHYFTDSKDGAVYKTSFSIEHEEAPIEEDESKLVRAFARGASVVFPDPNHPRRCKFKALVSINARLDKIPSWVKNTFGGTAQRVNAQQFGDKVKRLSAIARNAELKKRDSQTSHIHLNKGGKIREIAESRAGRLDMHSAREQTGPKKTFALPDFVFSNSFKDAVISFALVLCYVAAIIEKA